MAQTKRASNGKRSIKTVSVLGVAGASLAASATASSAEMPVASPGYQGTHFGVEELSDVSLATFHVINPDQPGSPPPGVILAGHCGCGHGCHGCGHGCHGCGHGCRCGHCGGCGFGWGCGGCCLSWGGCSPFC